MKPLRLLIPQKNDARPPRERWFLGGGIILAVASIALILVGLFTSAPQAGGATTVSGAGPSGIAPVVGYRAPDFTLRDSTGTPVQLRGLRGHPVVLNFWYLSCEGCREEMPLLQDAAKTHADAGTVILGINIEDQPDDARTFAQHLGITYPLIFDSHKTVLAAYTVTATPTSFFIDRAGIIRATSVGELDASTLQRDLAAIGG